MLKTERLGWSYGSRRVLQGIGLEAEPGAIVGLLGENGAGKTTLLQLLAGIRIPLEGTVEVEGCCSRKQGPVYREKTALLQEGSPLNPRRTVGDYLFSQAELWETPQVPLKEWLAAAELEAVWSQPMGQLSRGYRQRVGLVRSLIRNPRLLLLDEPFTALDPRQVLRFREILRSLKEERIILFSSHNLPEIYSLCDRILILKKGSLTGDFLKGNLEGQEELETYFKEDLPQKEDSHE